LKGKSIINAVPEHVGGSDVAVANTKRAQISVFRTHRHSHRGDGIGLEWKRIASVFADEKAET